MITLLQNPDFPAIDTEILQNTREKDPDLYNKLLSDDSAWNEGAKVSTEPPVEKIEEPEVEPENVVETKPEEITTEIPVETTPETHNPFYNFGVSDEFYKDLEEKGKIKEGKLHGKFTPDSEGMQEFWKYHLGVDEVRGKQANELGEKRKENVALKEQLDDLETQINEIKEKTAPIGELVDFNDDELPTGIKSEDMEVIRKVALDETSTRLGKIFKKEGVNFPTTNEDWDTLKTENPYLYAKADLERTKIANYLIQQTFELEKYNEMKPLLFEQTNTKAAEALVQEVSNLGLDPDSKEVKRLINDGFNFIFKKAKNDPTYWTKVATGDNFLRPDALVRWMKLNNVNVEKPSEKVIPSEPLQVDLGTNYNTPEFFEKATESLKRSFDTFTKKVSSLGYEINETKDYPVIDAYLEEMWSKFKADPKYFNNGLMNEEALSSFIFLNKPEFIKQKQDEFVESAKLRALQDQEKFFASRKVEPFPETIAADKSGVRVASEIPLPEPEIYKDSKRIVDYAHRFGVSVSDLFNKIDPIIATLPNKQEYGF